MDADAAICLTDYSIGPAALGRALEERGLGSLWNLPSAKADEVLPVLDRCSELMRQAQS